MTLSMVLSRDLASRGISEMAKLRSFQLLKPSEYTGPVASAYAKINSMSASERAAAQQKFLSDAQVKIDAMYAKGGCSKEDVSYLVGSLCPF